MGKVYLVGAGCGALDLYTLKAMQCIENADCLVYDALIDNRILEVCKDVLGKQFPEYAHYNICMPSEYMRRVGQSIAAASLPKNRD